MSFRLRALTLVLFVAVIATGATAWLTLRQATRQVRDSLTASQQQANEVAGAVRGYGQAHAIWSGVDQLVGDLSRRTGQRIRLETVGGAVLADSDVIGGRTPRGVVGIPILVDVRPSLILPAEGNNQTLVRLTLGALTAYQANVAYTTCLTRAGAAGAATNSACTATPVGVAPEDAAAALACADKPEGGAAPCLTDFFANRVARIAPEPVRVYLGAVGESVPEPRAGPTVVAAIAVVLVAMTAALLLSRGVLRPVHELRRAARAVGAGDWSRRVPVSGRDEIAQLAQAFNAMADSLQSMQDSQRRLTADIAHELRTPLANLRGYLEALRDGVMQPSPALLESLHEEVLLQQRVVDDLQELALAESGRLTYHQREIDLDVLVQAAASVHSGQASAVGVTLATGTVEPVPVWADPDRLRQVVANLVGNAIRATPAGGTVTVSVRRERLTAVLSVADTGIGIAAADLPRVFDRFWRADPARGRDTGGSGLGLAVARQIVLDHRGEIEVSSQPGHGSVFTVRLPVT